jgi:methyl-accepting chemotaxis protein
MLLAGSRTISLACGRRWPPSCVRLRTDMAVVRESTSRLPKGIAKIEKAVTGLSAKLDHVQEEVGNVHADMSELNANVEKLVGQLEAMQDTLDGMKGSVEEVIKDLPGAGGSGVVARVRDAIGGEGS